MTPISFHRLDRTDSKLLAECEAAIGRVIARSEFILGPAVREFEAAFAAYLGARHCVGVSNGTVALQLALLAAGVGPGDEVITTPHSWISTAWGVTHCGATPVFVDIEPSTYTLDAGRVAKAISSRTKAILPVHLYGQPADLTRLAEVAKRHGLALIEDAAQAHGARHQGRRVGTIGKAGCFSFYPSKNLGAFGEAGAVVTDDDDLAERVRRLRDHAQSDRNHHVEVGFNARMEGFQGAVLGAKLSHLDGWNAARTNLARTYFDRLAGAPRLVLPAQAPDRDHAWHLFVVLVPDRDRVQERLAARGVETRVHYPTLVPFQPAYAPLGYRPGDFPVAESVAARCLSLPLYPEMTHEEVEYSAESLRGALQ